VLESPDDDEDADDSSNTATDFIEQMIPSATGSRGVGQRPLNGDAAHERNLRPLLLGAAGSSKLIGGPASDEGVVAKSRRLTAAALTVCP
jgi:hypothetical protein